MNNKLKMILLSAQTLMLMGCPILLVREVLKNLLKTILYQRNIEMV